VTATVKSDELADPAGIRAETARIDLFVARYGLLLVLLAAWTAMLGSLFFSEVLRWVPCTLCWYQRIAMYPIAVLTAVGLVVRDRSLPIYTITLAAIGLVLSSYHWLHQKVNWFDRVQVCASGVSCKGDYLGRGIVTIPFLAWVAFLIVLLASIAVWRRRDLAEPAGPRPWLPVVVTIVASFALMGLLMLLLPNARLQWLGR
jgi:disulfide bond formation protein DsbB